MRRLLVLLLAVACATPQHSSHDYQGAARKTAQAVASSVATAVLGASQHDRASGAYLTTLIESAEKDALKEQGKFDALQPPDGPRDDRIRTALDDLAGDATVGLARMRIACHRGDLDALPGLADELRPTLVGLRDLADRLPS
jgi:hypothetical protein